MSTAERLSADERAEIAALAAQEPLPRAACINALRAVQARRRYISDEILADIADALAMSTAALDEVATFYNLIFRKPVGQTVILLCDSIACWMQGQPELAAHLASRLGISFGQTTVDNKFTLLPIVCLGHCEQAPAGMIGNTVHGRLTAAALNDVLLS